MTWASVVVLPPEPGRGGTLGPAGGSPTLKEMKDGSGAKRGRGQGDQGCRSTSPVTGCAPPSAQRWAGYLTLVLLVGLLGGLGMGSFAAARRTQSSFSTFVAGTNPSDLECDDFRRRPRSAPGPENPLSPRLTGGGPAPSCALGGLRGRSHRCAAGRRGATAGRHQTRPIRWPA